LASLGVVGVGDRGLILLDLVYVSRFGIVSNLKFWLFYSSFDLKENFSPYFCIDSDYGPFDEGSCLSRSGINPNVSVV